MDNRIALAVAATAGIGMIALLAVLRSDSMMRRSRGRDDLERGTGYQLDRWANEGGSIPDVSAGAEGPGDGVEHA
jgi:hypothetical protein